MEEKPNYYAIIPACVRYDTNLNANAKLLYGEITALSNKNGYCTATNEYFSNLYNVSTRTITEWIKSLEESFYVVCEIETKRYDDGTVKKIRKIYINHIEVSDFSHVEDLQQDHIEENFSYNNTSNNNNINKKEIYKEKKPTLEEIQEYCKERNSSVNPKAFYDYFEVGGWKDSKGNKVKNWKQKLLTWEKFANNTSTQSFEPVWFDEAQDINEVSKQELKEMEEILNGFNNIT